ncbi:nucleotide exchange factor GrpE [Selenihalanaerobacter shriftii]|uniref:Protein GrpE n=1 Tax=Selenihalanaerobacter shriftii TaxID=142842 RepID=A0A1T4PYE9_9FIRM|nr:nucleotide exchange factor GrpE [Selenihalanaerobacter shriftii]SJZ96523.1 molecular chaperone GrpE [Selenihalanaerobacter shriftii]
MAISKEKNDLEKEALEREQEEKDQEKINDDEDNKIEVEITEENFIELQEELERSELEKQKYIDRLQRSQAEFSNYKKRVRREKERLKSNATKELVNELLPVLDNFERALSSSKDNQDLTGFLEGVEMVSRQLTKVLKEEGLKVIPTVGDEFDPKIHEAVMQVESDEYESGIITEELQKGYIFNDQVLRASMVKVAK